MAGNNVMDKLKDAHATIAQGQDTGNQSAVDAGMAAQSQILKDNGIVYPTGNKGAGVDTSTTPLPKSWGGTGIISGGGSYSAAAKGSGEGDALASALKSLYGSNGLYASALAAQQKANQANVDKAVSTLEGQKDTTNRSYADMFRQLYQQKKNAQKNIGQQMAAQGVTGGASESTLLGMETSYAEALRQGNQGRADALGELDRAITAAKLDGDIANAQLAADSAREQTAGYASVLQGLLNRYDSQQAQQTAYEREDAANKLSYARQLAISIAQGGNMPTDDLLTAAGMTRADAEAIVAGVAQSRQDEQDALTYSQALQKAETLAAYGDFSGYAALGYTAAEIAAMKTAYDKAVAAEKAANQTPWKPKLTAAQTLDALGKGVVNNETLAAYKYWYGQEWKQPTGTQQSQKIVHEMTQDEIDDLWGSDSGYSSGGSIGVIGGTSTYNRKTSVGYDANKDTITWNGKTYTDSDALTRDIMAAGLTETELEELKKNFAVYGFTLE